MSDKLSGCWLKIERAKEHRDGLHAYIAETFAIETNRPGLGAKFDPDTGEHVLFVNYMPDLTEFFARCSVVLGDAVHNLISALDHLAYQLALLHTGGQLLKPNRIQFPITESAADFAEQTKSRLREVDPGHIAIIERFQGYHRLDGKSAGPYIHPLSRLRDLASTDKHKLPIALIVPTLGFMLDGAVNPFGQVFLQRIVRLGFLDSPPAELGAEIMRAKLPPGAMEPEVKMAGYVLPQVAVPPHSQAVPVVDKIAAVVVQIVREFEPFF